MKWFIDSQGNPYSGDRQGLDTGILARPEDGNPYQFNKDTMEWETAPIESAPVEIGKSTSISATAEQLSAFDAANDIESLKAALKQILFP